MKNQIWKFLFSFHFEQRKVDKQNKILKFDVEKIAWHKELELPYGTTLYKNLIYE